MVLDIQDGQKSCLKNHNEIRLLPWDYEWIATIDIFLPWFLSIQTCRQSKKYQNFNLPIHNFSLIIWNVYAPPEEADSDIYVQIMSKFGTCGVHCTVQILFDLDFSPKSLNLPWRSLDSPFCALFMILDDNSMQDQSRHVYSIKKEFSWVFMIAGYTWPHWFQQLERPS